MIHKNPPTPAEGPVENLKNALAILQPIVEESSLFTPEDMVATVSAANVRIRRVIEQLEAK